MTFPSNVAVTRFWSLSGHGDVDSCWVWRGRVMWKGYGELCADNKKYRAHRLSWEIHYGPIPFKKQVLHRCDVRSCVNPGHLFLGTAADNVNDMVQKGRIALRSLERNGMAKLDEGAVRVIRRERRKTNPRSLTDLAREYGVSKRAIHFAATGRNWASLDEPVATIRRTA